MTWGAICPWKYLPIAGSPHLFFRAKLERHMSLGPCGPGLYGWLPGAHPVPCPWQAHLLVLLTSAGWLCLIPLGVMGVNTFNDDGALL